MANWTLINKTLANIEAHPESFNMQLYAADTRYPLSTDGSAPQLCDTTMCFAGWAVFTAGETFAWNTHRSVALFTSEGISIEIKARALLGLTYEEADQIFYETKIQTVDELREHIINVTRGES